MSIGIVFDEKEETAVCYCNTTGMPFGPVIRDCTVDTVEAFLKFARFCEDGVDPRKCNDIRLKDHYDFFCKLGLDSVPRTMEIYECEDVGEWLTANGFWSDEEADFIVPAA